MGRSKLGILLVGCVQLACSADGRDIAVSVKSHDLLAGEKTQATLRASISAVGVDCSAFTSYTAALATRTVDCLGTIAPDSFAVTSDGFLQRNFDRCAVDATQLSKIDSLLSLQRREARLPNVKECFAGRYADYVRGFEGTGVNACPAWSKQETVNPITSSTIEALLPQLAERAELKQALTAQQPLHIPHELEEQNLYRASYDATTPKQQMEAGDAAAHCAAGFAGFVLETTDSTVLTDPVAWLLNTTYAGPTQDPFLRPGYYHPMSWYGGPPGVHWGDAARFKPCPTCEPEWCTYYTGVHKLTKLQLDCIVDSEPDTCSSYCGPPL